LTEKKKLKPTQKICPLLAALSTGHSDYPTCLGDRCALYVKMHKLRNAGGYPDPDTYLVYEGCGLIVNIPWEVREIERKPQER